MDKIICLLGGLVIGATAALLILAPFQQPDKALVLRCRDRVERFLALPEADREAWLHQVRTTPALHTRWKATCVLNNAFGGVPVDVP